MFNIIGRFALKVYLQLNWTTFRTSAITKFILFYTIFLVESNEAECPYCPPGMQCDPATNTCIKGSYCRQHYISSDFIFSFFIAIERFVNMYVLYIFHVHILQIMHKILFIQSTKCSVLLLSCMITKNDFFEIFLIFFLNISFLSRRMFFSWSKIRILFRT